MQTVIRQGKLKILQGSEVVSTI